MFFWSWPQILLVCWLSFPLPLFPCQGYGKFLVAHHAVHKNPRSGPLVHLLRLFTPLEPLYHPDIMQNSVLLHEAYSCLNKTFCSRIPSDLSTDPNFPWSPDLDLKQKGKGCWAFPGDTACQLNSGTPSIVPSSPLVTVLSPSVFYGSHYSKYNQKLIIPQSSTAAMMVWDTISLHLYHCNCLLTRLCFLPWISRVDIQKSSHSDSLKNASYITGITIRLLYMYSLLASPSLRVKSNVLTLTYETLCNLPVPPPLWQYSSHLPTRAFA